MKPSQFLQRDVFQLRRVAIIWLALLLGVVVFATSALVLSFAIDNQVLVLFIALLISIPVTLKPQIHFIKSKTMESKRVYSTKSAMLFGSPRTNLRFVSQALVPLSKKFFFDKILNEFRELRSGDRVLAIETFDPLRCHDDPREQVYFQEYKKAIERGASIEKIFILSRFPATLVDARKVLQRHIEIGVIVFVVFLDALHGRNEPFKKFMLFEGDEPRLYVEYENLVNRTGISHGELRLDKNSRRESFEYYGQLKKYAILPSKLEAIP